MNASLPLQPGNFCISAVTRGELLYGINLKVGAHRLSRLVDQFLGQVSCLPWDAAAARHFAIAAAELNRAGTPVGSMDMMIAGHAIALGSVLVTNNERHFSRISGTQGGKLDSAARRSFVKGDDSGKPVELNAILGLVE